MTNLWYLYMGFGAILLSVGLYCLLTMKNIIKLFIGIEIIAKAISLILILGGFLRHNLALAQALVITFIVVEVSMVAVALAIIINVYRHTGSLDIRKLSSLKG